MGRNTGSLLGRRRVRIAGTILGVAIVAPLLVVANAAKATAPPHEAYVDATSSYHQARTSALKAQGYRPLSLSVFGSTTDPRYAAVWVQRPGPEFITFQGYSRTTVARASLSYRNSGHHLAMLTAATDGNGTVYAGMFVKSAVEPTIGIDLTAQELNDMITTARSNNQALRWMAAYGDRFAAIFWPDASNTPWGNTGNDNAANFDQIETALTGARLNAELVTQGSGSSAGRFFSIWRDEAIGRWTLENNLTKDQYDQTAANLAKYGYFPIRVQGGGGPGAITYSAIFALDDTVRDRQMRYTGTGPAALAGFDDYVGSLMRSKGIRAGALAIVKDGSLVMSRGYTWAESSYPLTQPTSQFRIASCSKPITGIAVSQMAEEGKLTWNTKMQDILKLKTSWGADPLDTRVADITISNLTGHAGGWDRDLTFDPMFRDPNVAAETGGALPVTKSRIATYMAARSLSHTPGTVSAYSNFGYSLLGQIVESKAGLGTYENVVKQKIFAPLGLTRPAIAATTKAGRASDEVLYHPTVPGVGRSVLTSTQPWVARQYGAFNVENMDSHGGWRLAVPDFARIFAAFDAPDNPLFQDDTMKDIMWGSSVAGYPDVLKGWFGGTLKDGSGTDRRTYIHNGRLDGTSCLVLRRSDNLSWVLLLNGDMQLDWTHANELNAIANSVSYWPTENLFPAMGIN